MEGISAFTERDTVDNVLIYIVDSLRLDYLPERVANRGLCVPTIAASTYTASSIPSMMTGQYPASHRIWGFNDVLKRTPCLLSGPNAGMDLRKVWIDIEDPAQKPPNRVLGLKQQHTLEKAGSGFTLVIHEKGAHAPYDFFNVDFDGSPSYFEHHSNNNDKLKNEYEKGINSAVDRFFETVLSLEERGELENTLVVFTSDHGELLGETNRGGVYAHGSPVCPELVEVPTVFLGAGLPTGEQVDWTMSGADLAPTALSAKGEDSGSNQDGLDLWTNTPADDRVIRSDFWAKGGRVEYAASSAWDSDGGYVLQFNNPLERLSFAVHRKLVKGFQAPANRSRLPESLPSLLRTFGKTEITYGSPSPACKNEVIPEFEEGDGKSSVDEISKEQLRALGYVD